MRQVVLALIVCVAAPWAGACSSSTQNVTSPSTVKCAVTAAATPSSFSAAGGSGTLSVSTNRECQWSAAAAGSWIQFDGTPTGQGDATIAFNVATNSDPGIRKGTISVGDQRVGITQDAA